MVAVVVGYLEKIEKDKHIVVVVVMVVAVVAVAAHNIAAAAVVVVGDIVEVSVVVAHTGQY